MNATIDNAKLESKRSPSLLAAVVVVVASLVAIQTAMAQPKVPVLRKASSNMNYATDRVLVRLTPSATASSTSKGKLTLPGVKSMDQLTGVSNGVAAKGTGRPQWFVARLNPDMSVEQALQTLSADPAVSAVKPDFIRSIPRPIRSFNAAAADPNEGQQYALERIEAAAAWQIESGKKSVVVAVIDTGVQLNHPDLSAQMWTNPNETQNGVDDDNNGFVDDVRGWNFVSGNNNPNDDNEHGTHCSGIIAATRGNGVGIAGTANVTIMPLKVLDDQGRGTGSDIMQAVQYAADNGASIVSMSLGGGGFDEAEAEIYRDVIARGVVVIAASGNESSNQIGFPSAYEGVISVGATDINDQIADFSNTGEGLAISAPGVDVLSTVPGSGYDSFSGTSMATPYVAGVAALLRSVDANMSVDTVRQRLMDSADDLGAPGYDTVFGAGRVNARKALANDTTPNPNPSPTPSPTPAPGGNTSPERALAIQPGQYKGTCQSELWYKISLTRSAKIDVTISGNQGDLDLFVMDMDGQLVADSAFDGSDEAVSTNVAAGQYLIAIAAYEGQSGSFTMNFSTSATGPGNPGTPDPDFPGYPDDGFDPGAGEMCGAGSGMPMFAMVAGLMGGCATTRRRRK